MRNTVSSPGRVYGANLPGWPLLPLQPLWPLLPPPGLPAPWGHSCSARDRWELILHSLSEKGGSRPGCGVQGGSSSQHFRSCRAALYCRGYGPRPSTYLCTHPSAQPALSPEDSRGRSLPQPLVAQSAEGVGHGTDESQERPGPVPEASRVEPGMGQLGVQLQMI